MTSNELETICHALREAGIDNCANEARWMLEHATARQLSPEETQELVQRRCHGEPFQYVLGNTEFYGLELSVGPGVLIPRPETEELVEHALAALRQWPLDGDILDLCTGSGAIALALAAACPDRAVLATDISPDALAWAVRNRDALGLANVTLLQSDLFENLPPGRRFGLLTANPPYVSPDEYDVLPCVVRDYEPRTALLADEDGLRFYRLIADQARDWLLPGAGVFLEIGASQGDAVRGIFLRSGYDHVDILQDLSGRDRILRARRPAL